MRAQLCLLKATPVSLINTAGVSFFNIKNTSIYLDLVSSSQDRIQSTTSQWNKPPQTLWSCRGSSWRANPTTPTWCRRPMAPFFGLKRSAVLQPVSLAWSPGADTASLSSHWRLMVLRQLHLSCPHTHVCVPLSNMLKLISNSMRNMVCMRRIFVNVAHWCFFHCTSPEPDRVEPSVSSQGSNSSLLVSWRPPLGRLEHYCILLNSSFLQDVQELTVANTSNHHIFGNLSAGRLYSVQITVHSGPKEASSGFVFNATCKSGSFH